MTATGPGYRRDEARFLAATFITNLGNGIQTIAAAWLTLVETDSIVSVGVLFVIVTVPQALVSMSSGSLSDRGSRRRLCIASDLARAVCVAAIPLALAFDSGEVAVLYVSSFVVSLLDAVFVPVANGWAQQFVPPEEHRRFSSRFEIATQAGMLLSVAAGGFLAQWFGAGLVFGANAITFVASAALLAGMTPDRPGSAAAPAPAGDEAVPAVEPLRPDWRRVAPAVILFAQVRVVPTVMNTLTVVLVIDVFDQGMGMLGLTDALAAVGFGSAALLFTRLHRRLGDLGATALGFGLCALFIVPQPLAGQAGLMVTFTIATMLFGLGRVGTRVLLMSQAGTARAGQVFGASNALGLFLGAVGTLLISWVAVHWSIEVAYVVVAAYLLVVTVACLVPAASRPTAVPTPTAA